MTSFGETDPVPYSSLIFVEPPFMNKSALPALAIRAERTTAYNSKQRTEWPSVEAALAEMKTRVPWRTWDAEVMRIFAVGTPSPFSTPNANLVELLGYRFSENRRW
jgi:hypothetical protein